MNEKIGETVPKYFGWFILLAMLPQILGFNGSAIDSIYKLLLLGWLFIKTAKGKKLGKISNFTSVFILIGLINTVGTIATNNVSIFGELYTYFVGVILAIVLIDSALNERTLRYLDVLTFYKVFVYFMLLAAIYNMIIHFNSLLHITSVNIYSAESVCSFFDNKNTYGVFLIFAVLASTILRIITKERKWMFFSGIFLVNEMMALCRTAILLSLILIAISFWIDERKRFKNILIFFMIISIGVVILNTNKAVSEYVLNIFGNTQSVDSRNSYVESLLPFAKGIHFWFGYGSQGALELATLYTGNAYYHNAYLKALMMGGIIKLCMQIYAILTSLMYGLKCRKIQKNTGNLCLLSTLIYIIYVFVESVILFDTPVVAIMAAMFIISMPIMFYNSLINEENQR